MQYRFAMRAAATRSEIEGRLLDLMPDGPFRVRDVSPLGGECWSFVIEPARPSIAVGFGKVAEFLVLLAREFEVLDVGRVTNESMAAVG